MERFRKDGNGGRWVDCGSLEVAILDPLFWQALGKSMGWGESLECALCEIPTQGWSAQWRKKALQFHAVNLSLGWEKAVEYLESITNPQQ